MFAYLNRIFRVYKNTERLTEWKEDRGNKKWHEPKSVKELRGFLGLLGYYRRFVKDFAKIAKPLTTVFRGEKNSTKNKTIVLNAE